MSNSHKITLVSRAAHITTLSLVTIIGWAFVFTVMWFFKKGIQMFFTETIIDSIQNAKKNAVNSLVTNETIKDSMLKFVDNQTAYTKEAAKNFSSLATTMSLQLFSETSKSVSEMTKFDWFKPVTSSK